MASGELVLTCWIHPTMKIPFPLDPQKHPFRVPPTLTVMELMQEVEALIEGVGRGEATPVQVELQVLWNLRNKTSALNPGEKVGAHFCSGDTFGVYGDIMQAPRSYPSIPEERKMPVTILTGFLGSGKTTLLNYILQEQKEKKIAVIENEFGEVSIDDALLKQDKLALAEKVIVMDNGCMCCTVRGDLIAGLRSILDEVHKGAKIDAIIIETTGMADPVPIVRTFMTSPEISSELRLDGVVAVADAKHIIARLDDDIEEGKVNEAYQQVAFCDKLLLNKLDLVTADQAIAVKDRLRSVNAFAKILPAVRGRVRMSELTDLRAHDMTHFVDADIEKEAGVAEEHGHGGGHGGHGHGGRRDRRKSRRKAASRSRSRSGSCDSVVSGLPSRATAIKGAQAVVAEATRQLEEAIAEADREAEELEREDAARMQERARLDAEEELRVRLREAEDRLAEEKAVRMREAEQKLDKAIEERLKEAERRLRPEVEERVEEVRRTAEARARTAIDNAGPRLRAAAAARLEAAEERAKEARAKLDKLRAGAGGGEDGERPRSDDEARGSSSGNSRSASRSRSRSRSKRSGASCSGKRR